MDIYIPRQIYLQEYIITFQTFLYNSVFNLATLVGDRPTIMNSVYAEMSFKDQKCVLVLNFGSSILLL